AAIANYLNSAERTQELDKLYDYGYDTGFDACLSEVKKLYPNLNLDSLSADAPTPDAPDAVAAPVPHSEAGPSKNA
ncbi:hypothetical protein PJP10_32445, partial [Mycobacterium kansasii]